MTKEKKKWITTTTIPGLFRIAGVVFGVLTMVFLIMIIGSIYGWKIFQPYSSHLDFLIFGMIVSIVCVGLYFSTAHKISKHIDTSRTTLDNLPRKTEERREENERKRCLFRMQ